jgi:hypothetical protein
MASPSSSHILNISTRAAASTGGLIVIDKNGPINVYSPLKSASHQHKRILPL